MADWPDDTDDVVFEQLEGQDTLDYEHPEDPLDEGYSAAEAPWGATDWGTTGREAAAGEHLATRLAREVREAGAAPEVDGLGDTSDTEGELLDREVGNLRAGRLTAAEGGDAELFATDVGVDGAGASA
ncbi:hypothetical protein FNH05_34220, partial [Amycolatopsis rhizosphaerae]